MSYSRLFQFQKLFKQLKYQSSLEYLLKLRKYTVSANFFRSLISNDINIFYVDKTRKSELHRCLNVARVPVCSVHYGILLQEFSSNDRQIEKHFEIILKDYAAAQENCSEGNEKEIRKYTEKCLQLQPLVSLIQEREKIKAEIKELGEMIADLNKQKDKELLIVAVKEYKEYEQKLEQCQIAILDLIIPSDIADDRDIIMEFSAGVGGKEAMLFTKDIYSMYCNYVTWKGWHWEEVQFEPTELGGLRQASMSIRGHNVFKYLKFESGVHRVQRVPKTEKSGRIHTSTMSVAVLPQPTEIDIVLHPKDIQMEFKRSSGAGGQHVNKTESCVRIVHLPTGIFAESQMERCQHRNKELALKTLRARLYQKQLDKVIFEQNMKRKLQIGSAGRSEKIRTYNFIQDRISDHRLKENFYNVELFLQGQEKLEEVIESLQTVSRREALQEIVGRYDT